MVKKAFYAMAGVAGMEQEGNVPGTERDGDAAGTGQGGETPGAGLDGDTAGTSQDGETPEAGLGGDVPGTDPGEEAPVDTAYTVTFDLAGGFASDGAAEVQLQVDAGALLEEMGLIFHSRLWRTGQLPRPGSRLCTVCALRRMGGRGRCLSRCSCMMRKSLCP